LIPFEFASSADGGLRVREAFQANWRPIELLRDVNLLRTTNNLVFADIAWAHLAYQAEGMGVVRAGLSDLLATHSEMLAGFEALDRGRALSDQTTGAELIWEGALHLLRHEQTAIVQEQFLNIDQTFNAFLSAFTDIDFDGDNFMVDLGTHTSFYPFMLAHARDVLLSTMSLPDIRRFEHRWAWIERAVWSIWRSVSTAPTVLAAIDRLRHTQATSLI